jgi:small subunit ribosomal protein S18
MRDNFGSRDGDFGAGKKDFGKKRKARRPAFRRKRPPANMVFDYKDVHTLMMFLTEEGKIVPGRVSGLSASQQRELTLAIKRARHLSLISPVRRESVH